MITVISIGGSVIAPRVSFERFEEYARAIKEIAKKHTVFVVVGGGAIARDYIRAVRDSGASEAMCDFIGIEVTRLNARLLISALGEDAYPEPPVDYRAAKKAMMSGKIVVMGGVTPGQTTDAVAAILAEYTGVDLLVNATCVDGVYTSDPKMDPKAKKLDRITSGQLVEIVMKTGMCAGAKSVIDPLAAKIIERSKIPMVVLDGSDPRKIVDAILKGKHDGTDVIS